MRVLLFFFLSLYSFVSKGGETCGVYEVFYIPLGREYYIPSRIEDLEKRSLCKFNFSSCQLDKIDMNSLGKKSNVVEARIKIVSKEKGWIIYLNSKKEIFINSKILKTDNKLLLQEFDKIIDRGEKCKTKIK